MQFQIFKPYLNVKFVFVQSCFTKLLQVCFNLCLLLVFSFKMSMLSFFRNETPAERGEQVVVECFVLVASDQQGVMQGCITFDPTRIALGSRYYSGLLGSLEIFAEKGTKLKAFLKVPGFDFISIKDTSVMSNKLEHFFEFGENVSCIPFWLK